jgi:adenylate cyclase
MLIQCYEAERDAVRAREAAAVALERIDKLLAIEPDNGGALGFAVSALVCLGDFERAKTRAEDAMLLDPDNTQLTYNLACAMTKAGETEFALELLDRAIDRVGEEGYLWAQVDTDLDSVRGDPRFTAIMDKKAASLAKMALSGAAQPAA